MARLLVHVEGQTEEDFVNFVLRDYLLHCGYQSVSARIIGNARLRRRRGGIRPWLMVRKDIVNHLHEDPGCVATTMVDFYGLPQHGDRAWPGRAAAVGASGHQKASVVEEALRDDLAHEMGTDFDITRFLPFVVVHEFEGLLFIDCAAFARGICRPDLEPSFSQIREGFATPEDIDDSPVTAPSKRVEELVPGYEKPLFGALAILEIGLDPIRAECPHFDDWLHQLESLVA
ncbi:MAG: DUF4276 family protein [Terriglobia bacterium]|jgi:hypothetical protein